MSSDKFHLAADAGSVRRLRELLQQGTLPAAGAAAPVTDAEVGEPVVVELIDDLPDDDFDAYAATQVYFHDGLWKPLQEVSVRKITAAKISAGSAAAPTRLLARPVGNLGLCVLRVDAENSGSQGIDGITCCGCQEAAGYDLYDWGSGNEPVFVRVTHPDIGCCLGANGSYTILERETPGGTTWEAPAAVDCGDSTELDWELTAAGVLTATHSAEGIVARYTRDSNDDDMFCAMRFYLDEATTPMHDRDCTICGLTLCLQPDEGP